MAWVYLIIAGLFEVVWAYTMKQSDGFTKLAPTLIAFSTMAISVVLLSTAMRSLPLGTAYLTWMGIGAIGTVLAGFVLLNEPLTAVRIGSMLLVVVGVIGLKLTSTS
ncbi:multidrug efflux SMR transporter [Methyloligella sp. 2.7D]|uniref:DMT family transporter n=1 Tax=unclassified Methyloligella TaxID=2625955 RepID=UPI00157E0DAF|nr:multidrug efflux SMR transporter [Methyloligella sp. GL2]QKP76530.1 multidrug efflux SMR transporter [Methyloligella sp. GL2]